MSVLNLIIQYVNDPAPGRQGEFDECVRRNLDNPQVKSVHNLQEHAGVVAPPHFTAHPKYRAHALNRWLTFADAFAYAGAVFPGEICCLLNLDIFLDPTSGWQDMPEILRDPIVFCLSRHEYSSDGRTWIDPKLLSYGMATSQDAWVFRAPINITDCDFGIGVLGCDNAIAKRIKESNYLPVNAPSVFRIFHLDRVRGKNMDNHGQVHAEKPDDAARRKLVAAKGQYLLPDIDTVKNVEELLVRLNVNRMGKYSVICDVMSKFIHLDNDA